MTVHLIYPHGARIAAPDAIGRNLGQRLAEPYHVVYYDWNETRGIKPSPDDVLLGHPHPYPWTIFRRSLKQPGWRRIIAMSPYGHGDIRQVAFMDSFLRHCDLYLAITGRYWYSSVGSSCFSHWLPKMVHLDQAVNRNDFPVIKMQFNPPGCRRFVYIGSTGWLKNIHYLTEIARRMADVRFSWIGSGGIQSIQGLTSLGCQDFSTDHAKRIVASHDFVITVGNSDANPTTILEAMAWGLIPVCTPQSGYVGYPGIVNVPLGDVGGTVDILQHLQMLPEAKLREMQTINWEALDSHFNWDRFTQQVVEAIESDASPALGAASPLRRLRIWWAAVISPYSPVHWSRFKRYLVSFVRRSAS